MSGNPLWLEVLKLVVCAVTAVAVVLIGNGLAKASKRVEAVQWANQTVIERRLEIFAEVAPKLNRILCFALFVGGWKETMPGDVITLKRTTDETMYVNRILFSRELFAAYERFVATLFQTYARRDSDAPIRAAIDSKLGDRRKLTWWEEEKHASCFVADPPSAEEINKAYEALGEAFRRDLYVARAELQLPTPK